MNQRPAPFWSLTTEEVLTRLGATPQGLTSSEARARLIRFGSNLLKPKRRTDALTLLLAQFKSPIILILIFDAGLSLFLQDHVDAVIILAIVLVSGLLGFWQERGAAPMPYSGCWPSCRSKARRSAMGRPAKSL